MKVRTKRKICGVISFLGLMLVIGTATASDVESISLQRIVVQSLIGLAMFAGAGYKGGWMS